MQTWIKKKDEISVAQEINRGVDCCLLLPRRVSIIRTLENPAEKTT